MVMIGMILGISKTYKKRETEKFGIACPKKEKNKGGHEKEKWY